MRRLRGQRGVVLVQVLTMSILLSTVAMMLIQWQFGRYVMAYRIEKSHRARSLAQSALSISFAEWSTTTPPVGGTLSVNDPVRGVVNVESYIVCQTLTGSNCVRFTVDTTDW